MTGREPGSLKSLGPAMQEEQAGDSQGGTDT